MAKPKILTDIEEALKNEGGKIATLSRHIKLTESTTSIPIGISKFNYLEDDLELHMNGRLLTKDVNYKLSESKDNIENIDSLILWEVNDEFDIKILKNVKGKLENIDPSLIPEKGIVESKLSEDLQNKINSSISKFDRKTYAELKLLKDNSQLQEGKRYLLTDYRTKYIQPTTNALKEMEVEELVLTAINSNSFEPIVFSTKYPQDTVWYNFNASKCEDGTTPRNGFILRRYDSITRNDCPHDWRTILWTRYKPDVNQYYKDGVLTDYSVWTGGNAVMGTVYKVDNALYVPKNTNVPSSNTDSNVFEIIYSDMNTGIMRSEKEKFPSLYTNTIELKRGELHERLTFGYSCENNFIASKGNTSALIDTVFDNYCSHNIIDTNSICNTFGKRCENNKLGSRCIYNRFMETCSFNTFGVACGSNYLTNSWYNIFGAYCGNNCFTYGTNNTFGIGCDYNTFSSDCKGNAFGNNCSGNTFGNGCTNNTFLNNCISNVFDNGCYGNSFGNNCSKNSFGSGCYSNSFGNTCGSGNSFGNNCVANNFGNDCYNNKFGNNFSYNNIGSNCAGNTIGDGFNGNFIKFLRTKNIIGLSVYGKPYIITFQMADNGRYVFWYLNTSNQPVYTVIP